MAVDSIIEALKALGNPSVVARKEKKFGIQAKNTLGIYNTQLNAMAKDLGKDSEIAIQLFETGIYEARLLCSKLFRPKDLTEELMEKWVTYFDNWEICDSFSMQVFARSQFAVQKALEWSKRRPEFEKRAGFAIMAANTNADKKADNTQFQAFFPPIVSEATDERLYVKKGISWALRSIGKRNHDLKTEAIAIAEQLKNSPSKSAKWIGSDAYRELTRIERLRDYPRAIYRPK